MKSIIAITMIVISFSSFASDGDCDQVILKAAKAKIEEKSKSTEEVTLLGQNGVDYAPMHLNYDQNKLSTFAVIGYVGKIDYTVILKVKLFDNCKITSAKAVSDE